MLSVTLAVNGQTIAKATAVNRTEVGTPCRYDCEWRSAASPVSGSGPFFGGFIVTHDRKASAWELVAAMARIIAEMEAGNPLYGLDRDSPSPRQGGGNEG